MYGLHPFYDLKTYKAVVFAVWQMTGEALCCVATREYSKMCVARKDAECAEIDYQ